MYPLRPTEAIGPAIARTREILGEPRHWRTLLKITTVAFFAEIGGGLGLSFPRRSGNLPGASPAAQAMIVTALLGVGLVLFFAGLILLYVGSRLQFVMVEMVGTRNTTIAPLWRRYDRLTWRWVGLKLLYYACALGVVVVFAAPVLFVFWKHRVQGATMGREIAPVLLPAIALGFVVLLLLAAAYLLLRDFVLPFMAIESVSIAEALRRVQSMVASEMGGIISYLLLRTLLTFGLFLAGEIVLFLLALLSLIPLGIVGGLAFVALRHAGPAGTAMLVALGTVGAMIFAVGMACLALVIFGSVFVFTQAFALYFLAGRYPLLSGFLEPVPTGDPPREPSLPHAAEPI